jgi:hypothetical protein
MTEPDDDILDDLFHGCAFAAYIDQAIEEQGPPDCERTRRRACRYYEEALAAKNGRCGTPGHGQQAAGRRASR